eukprot:13104468-Alexandrium_andersonii.AAC.1
MTRWSTIPEPPRSPKVSPRKQDAFPAPPGPRGRQRKPPGRGEARGWKKWALARTAAKHRQARCPS